MRFQSYSNESFDRAQQIAMTLTERNRKAGKPEAPKHGYSMANFRLAESLLAAEEEGKPETYVRL